LSDDDPGAVAMPWLRGAFQPQDLITREKFPVPCSEAVCRFVMWACKGLVHQGL